MEISEEDKIILNKSVVGKDFLKRKDHPNNDTWLDYRLEIMKDRKENRKTKKYPDSFYKNELKAIDLIIEKLNI